METVNNLINSATKMVYGETDETNNNTTTTTDQSLTSSSTGNTTRGTEPLSGETGAGTPSQPYDAGNTTGEPSNNLSSSSSSSGPTTGSSDTSAIKSSATATAAQDVGSAPPESAAAPYAKQQGADKPNDAPDASQTQALENKREAADVAMGEGSTKESSIPTSGSSGTGNNSGVKSLVGDAPASGSSDDTGVKPLSGGDSKTNEEDDDIGLGSKSKEPGTGEKWIKTSGVAADGGDFDAAQAGAGKEADRILEEKGVHRESGNTGEPVDIPGNKLDSGSSDSTGKASLGQKLKDKLHIGSKDKS